MEPSFLSLLWPLQLDTLRGWWVLITVVTLIMLVVYVFVQYMFDDEEKIEHIDAEELIATIESQQPSQWDKLSDRLASRWSRLTTKSVPSLLDEKNDAEREEEIDTTATHDTNNTDPDTVTVLTDTITISEDDQGDVVVQEEILMTEETVDELEQHTKQVLHREQFESDLKFLKKKNKIEEYEKKLIEGLAIDPYHTGVLETLAYHYVDTEQHKKSLPLFKKLIDIEPSYHKALRKMGDIYVGMEDLDTAQVLVERAMDLSPNNPKYALTMVEILYNRGKVDDAITLMEQIVHRRPENISYREILVKLYEEVKDYPLIVQCYESMIIVDPTNQSLKRKLLEARTKVGN